MSWTDLPTNVRLSILQGHLVSSTVIDHSGHLQNLVCGDLEVLISTNNSVLVELALAACNIFVVEAEANSGGKKVFRPRGQHAAMMGQLVDQTRVLKSVGEKGVDIRKDSGAYVLDSAGPGQGTTAKDDAAPGNKASAGAPGEETSSHGWFWEMHKTKLERSMKLARALEKKAS